MTADRLFLLKKLWRSLSYTARLAGLTTVLVLVTVPLTVINNSRTINSVAQAKYKAIPTYQESGPTGCIVGGCSGELCSDAVQGPLNSICLYKPEYACYQQAQCERQQDGQCGWSQTAELIACLRESSSSKPTPTSVANTPPPCLPRPTCLDAPYPCEVPEPVEGWCPEPTVAIKALMPPINPTITSCLPRPICLDSEPPCLLAEPAAGWCEDAPTPKVTFKPPTPTSTSHFNSPPNLLTSSLKTARVGKQYRDLIIVQDTDTTDTLTLKISSLPPNLALGSCVQTKTQAGVRLTCPVYGKPVQTGLYSLTLIIQDGSGNQVETQLSLSIRDSRFWLFQLFGF